MCVAHTVAVRGGPRGPGVPRAATTCPSPGHRADLDMWCARRFRVCCIGCAEAGRTLFLGKRGMRLLAALFVLWGFLTGFSLPDSHAKYHKAKDAYYVAHQLASNEIVENAAGQWERVASLATRMLSAAYEISSSERPAAIEFAKEAKAEAKREVKEAVHADAARAYVDAALTAKTADDWRSVVALAERRLIASTDLPMSVENREGKIQDAKDAKAEAKAEAERKEKKEKKDKNAKAAMRKFATSPYPFSVKDQTTSSAPSGPGRSNHLPAQVDVQEVTKIKILDFDLLPVDFSDHFFNNIFHPSHAVKTTWTNESSIQYAVVTLGKDVLMALASGSLKFQKLAMHLEQEMGTLAYRVDIFVLLGPDKNPVGLIEVKPPKVNAENEQGPPVLEGELISGQVLDYMDMMLLYHNCDRIFAISTTLIEWRFYWRGEFELGLLQSDAVIKDYWASVNESSSGQSAPSSSSSTAPSTPQQASSADKSSPPRTPAKAQSSWTSLSVGEDEADEDEVAKEAVDKEAVDDIGDQRRMHGTRVLNSRIEEDASLIVDLFATFLVHMSQCKTVPREDPLMQFPLRKFALLRKGSDAPSTSGKCTATLQAKNYGKQVNVASGSSFSAELSKMREASEMNEFGVALLKAVRLNTFKYPARITTTKQLLLVEDLGYGATSHAFLACNVTATGFCVVKAARYMSKEITQADAAKSLEAEAVNWEKIYGVSDDGGDVLIQNLRVVFDFWGGRPCLIMPYCQPIPKEDRESYLDLVQTTLVEHFAKRGYIHHDVRWCNIGLVQVDNNVKAVVYDLAPHEDLTKGVCKAPSADLTDSLAQMSMSSQSSDDGVPKWIADAMKKLKSTM